MRRFYLSLLIGVVSLVAIVSSSWPSMAQDKPPNTLAAQILVEHNGVRQKYNVQVLIWDDGLAKLAQDWADKIAASGAIPPPHRAAGENLFWGTADQWPYNVTNSPHFSDPSGSFTGGAFGQSTSTFGERQIRFGLKATF